MRKTAFSLCLMCCIAFIMAPVNAKELTPRLNIACSANFSAAMTELKTLFLQTYSQPIEINISIASSGTLATQISHGAPYDIFFSADQAFPEQLKAQGIGIESAPYALGLLVLYSLDQQTTALEKLQNHSNKLTVVIANPKYAPYGKAAMQVLSQLKVTPKRLVKGTSVLHAYQYVESGHAELGFIAKSVLLATRQGVEEEIPLSWYEPISQHALLLSASPQARAFFKFVQTKQAQSLIQSMGYQSP